MAGVPRNLPIPRGTLSLGLAEYYANQVATAGAQVSGGVGQFANVGVFNNSNFGHLIYVMGCTVWSSDPAGAVILRRHQAGIDGGTIIQPAQLNPFIAMTDGYLFTNSDGLSGTGRAIWTFAGGGYPTDWPYDSPLAILPAGWQLYTDPPSPGSTIAASFRWFTIRGA